MRVRTDPSARGVVLRSGGGPVHGAYRRHGAGARRATQRLDRDLYGPGANGPAYGAHQETTGRRERDARMNGAARRFEHVQVLCGDRAMPPWTSHRRGATSR